jgi:low affinity Fe/Cu permease
MAILMDYVSQNCYKEILKQIQQREELFAKEINRLDSKKGALEKKLDGLIKEQQQKAEEEARASMVALEKKDEKKGDKSTKAPVKKGGKEAQILDPKEQEKVDTQKDIDKCKEHVEKYKKKLDDLKKWKDKYTSPPFLLDP